jgi:hypothetical protein
VGECVKAEREFPGKLVKSRPERDSSTHTLSNLLRKCYKYKGLGLLVGKELVWNQEVFILHSGYSLPHIPGRMNGLGQAALEKERLGEVTVM